MDFGFTEEQDLLRAEVRKFLDESCPIPEVRRIAESGEGFPEPLWKQVAELGWPGLATPERHGGVGLGLVDLAVVLEETGRSLFPAPLLSTILAAQAILEAGTPEQQAALLPRLADGSAVGTLALLEADDRLDPEGVRLAGVREGDGVVLTGEKLFVHDAGAATLFVVPFRGDDGELGLAVVERDARGVRAEDVPGIDLTRPVGRLQLAGARVGADALLAARPAAESLRRLLDVAACSVAAEMVGAAEAALQLTVGYARDRVQFGAPIGRFQGVKHPLAEMYVDVESVKSLVYYAAWALDERQPDASAAASRAKAYATEAFSRIGIDVVQLHGGIGYTWEYDAQLFLKRAKWARPAFGDADHHYGRVASLGGL